MSKKQNSIFKVIAEERSHQDEKWGEQNHLPVKWICILAEELGEAAKACLENDHTSYYEELIQVAASAVAAMESLDTGVKSVYNNRGGMAQRCADRCLALLPPENQQEKPCES